MYTEIKADLEQDENLDGQACLILDGGVFCENEDEKSIDFTIDIDGERLPDSVVNHRYPNTSYHTFTKKYGRRRCKVGYPILFEFDENGRVSKTIQLNVHVKTSDHSLNITIPVKLDLTREKPVCGLTFYIYFNSLLLRFFSYEFDTKSGFWNQHEWACYDEKMRDIDKHLREYELNLKLTCVDPETNTYRIEDSIVPSPQNLDELMM